MKRERETRNKGNRKEEKTKLKRNESSELIAWCSTDINEHAKILQQQLQYIIISYVYDFYRDTFKSEIIEN